MNSDIKRLVVTGATGFIGSRLVDHALERGIDVVALVRDPDAMSHRERAGLTVWPWQFGAALPDIGGADAICHLAAVIPGDFNDPAQAAPCFETNVMGAMGLASQAADQGIAQFVYFSSGQIYSAGQEVATEGSPTYPSHRATYYLTSKLAGELCVQALSRTKPLKVTVLRLASVYGPGMHGKGMLPNYIERLSENQSVTVMDGGAYCVDFVHVDDVVAAACAAIEARAEGVFNVGTGNARTALEAARIVAATIGADQGLIEVQGSGDRHGFAALDIAKADALLSFKPMSLDEGIAAWHRSGQLRNFSR
jgi:UDP-glucose 4-epimerase